MIFGAPKEEIVKVEIELGLTLPLKLKEMLEILNGFECLPDWKIHGVFDPKNPKKTTDNLIYENTKARWEIMPKDYFVIADNGTGNKLILIKENNELKDEIYMWNHETNKIIKWPKSFDDLIILTRKRVDKIISQIEKSKKR